MVFLPFRRITTTGSLTCCALCVVLVGANQYLDGTPVFGGIFDTIIGSLSNKGAGTKPSSAGPEGVFGPRQKGK